MRGGNGVGVGGGDRLAINLGSSRRAPTRGLPRLWSGLVLGVLLIGVMMCSLPAQSLGLPDDRTWELVSPAVKNGALLEAIPGGGGIVQAAAGGGAITYLSINPAKSASEQEEPPAGNAKGSQVLSVRDGGGGWSSWDIATPYDVPTGAEVGGGQEYRWFSSDLSVGLVEPFGPGVPLSPRASERTIYLRDDQPLLPGVGEQMVYDEAEQEAARPEHEAGYMPLVTDCPPEGEKCGKSIEFVGATDDASHIVIRSRTVPLTADTPSGNPISAGGLYEWTSGEPLGEQLQLVSVLPEGDPAGEQASRADLGNTNGNNARNAISSNGSRVTWSYEESYEGETARPHLFMRDVQNEQTVRLDAIDGGSTGEGRGAQFQFANNDGSKVFFTDEEPLTLGSTAKADVPELYECEIVEEVGKLKCQLRDLTVSTATGHETEGADVLGVVSAGESEDSYVYVVANGVLTNTANGNGEKAAPGNCGGEGINPPEAMCNLYMLSYEEASKQWETVFIAALSGEDRPDWLGVRGDLQKVTSRVSPDGRVLGVHVRAQALPAITTKMLPVGNRTRRSISTDRVSGRLVCVSCNPSGERPVGVLDTGSAKGGAGLLVDGGQIIWEGNDGWPGACRDGRRWRLAWLAISLGICRTKAGCSSTVRIRLCLRRRTV